MSVRTVQLEEVAAVFNGKTPSKAEQRNSGHPVLKIKDVDDAGRFIGRFDSFVDPDLAAAFEGKAIQEGDTLILNAAHNAEYVASKSFFAHGSAVGALATGEWLLLRPLADQADARFIYFWSQHSKTRKKLSNLVKGIHLYPKDVAELPIPLPDLSEQKRIAGLLEQAERLRRTRRYAHVLIGSLLPAIFLELFGDPIKNPNGFPMARLQDLIEPDRPISYGILMPGPDIPDGVPYIRVTDIQDGQVVTMSIRRTTREIDQAYKRSKLRGGDLLLTIRGHVGRLAIVPGSLDGANITQDTARLAPTDHVNAHFLMGCLGAEGMQRRMVDLTRGAAVQGINLGDVKELPIPVPPLPLQSKFASLAVRAERLRLEQWESLRQADHLFQSLLHRAFTTGL